MHNPVDIAYKLYYIMTIRCERACMKESQTKANMDALNTITRQVMQ